MANNPLVGAWELVSDSRVGIRIYTGSHYAMLGAPKDRTRSAGNQATPDEALEAFNSCFALAGTYTLSGSRVTHTRLANTRPNLSGQAMVVDHAIHGDTMTATAVSGSGSGTAGSSLTFRRVGSSGIGSPLVGTWEMVEDARQGVLIYTGTHYALLWMLKERKLPNGDQYTPEEALEALTTSGALAGTYTIAENTVTMERIASSRPEGVGVAAVQEFTVEGDTLNLRGVSGIRPGEMNWRRVS